MHAKANDRARVSTTAHHWNVSRGKKKEALLCMCGPVRWPSTVRPARLQPANREPREPAPDGQRHGAGGNWALAGESVAGSWGSWLDSPRPRPEVSTLNRPVQYMASQLQLRSKATSPQFLFCHLVICLVHLDRTPYHGVPCHCNCRHSGFSH